MTKYRTSLPQLSNKFFLTDGGLETVLIFHEGIDLPEFAAFDLLKTEQGTNKLRDYYRQYTNIAVANKAGFILESTTWRASADWAKLIGYTPEQLHAINQKSIELLVELREKVETKDSPMVISGCIGPRGDGYNPHEFMTSKQAQAYHSTQIKSFSSSAADMVSAITMTYVEEAIGIALAAKAENIPVVISLTPETDGHLPNGQTLKEAIEIIDNITDSFPAYYMINCAHPTHFNDVVDKDKVWLDRVYGVRANASCKSHAELDESVELDDGNPEEFGQLHTGLRKSLTNLHIMGGCCGTDHRHINAIAKNCLM